MRRVRVCMYVRRVRVCGGGELVITTIYLLSEIVAPPGTQMVLKVSKMLQHHVMSFYLVL